ncbi:hypothetical protein [Streptomyces cinereoruber]|uniref:hypothetical protein n=1 Tax=Streptomyces cinereoruber TaxID=67260 RepID=UPI003C2AE1FF
MSVAPEVRRGGGLPFGQVVSAWVCDPRYSANLRTLYMILVTYADIGARDTSRGKPYRPELAAQLGVSVKTLDRTVLEGEVAGLFRVERRPDPVNGKLHDANVYHLRDGEFWRGEWTDPLAPGQVAAQVAADLVEARVKAKREAGILPRGGVPKGTQRPKKKSVASSVTPPAPEGGGVTGDARGGVMDDAGVASRVTPKVYSPVENPDQEPDGPPVRPSVRVENARVRNTDGGTDGGGGDVEDQEHGPATAAEEPTAAGTAPESRSGEEDTGSGPVCAVRPVELTPGVEVLRAIAAEAPQWTVTNAVSLRDQGRTVTVMLETGFTPQEVRHAILSRPLPQPLRTSVAGVISGRLRHLIAIGPASGITPIPAQPAGTHGPAPRGAGDQAETPTPVSWAQRRAQMDAEDAGHGRYRPCAGDEGLCPHDALPGLDRCAHCLGGQRPACTGGCGRGVVAPGLRCIVCSKPPAAAEMGDCPGYGGRTCGRAVQTEGLCARCKIEAEKDRAAAEAEWTAARDAAVATATAAEHAPAPAPF